MTGTTLAGGTRACLPLLLALLTVCRPVEEHRDQDAADVNPLAGAPADLLYARVATDHDGVYEGPVRFGGDEEAHWGHYFNGVKAGNPWAGQVPSGTLIEHQPIKILGVRVAVWNHMSDLARPFMARFGDIDRIDANGRRLRVTLRSGTVVDLDRYAADDFADGLRVWDESRGTVDLDEWKVRSIAFLPNPHPATAPTVQRLYGTVQTRQGRYTGFIQWDREASLGGDVLTGRSVDGDRRLPFATIRSITRRSRDTSLVTLVDGRDLLLTGSRQVGEGNHGVYVDDPRYGRVLVPWPAFERVDFAPAGNGPTYDDFQPGRALTGRVITRQGRQLTGRLVYDLDESETTETLDAPAWGVDYSVPFDLIATIIPPPLGADQANQPGRVILRSGEVLLLEATGDLGDRQAGMLIFREGTPQPMYVPWADVAKIDLFPSPAM